MFRCYCDICGADITDYRSERAEATVGRLRISVMTAIDNVWNGGHVCLDCIRSACAGLSIPRRPNHAVHLTPAPVGLWDANDDAGAAAGEPTR
jgi:hypothetical protein